ncbi:MAG: hypothetical protein U0516_04675 [Candidatus Saccharibacteria bacterium]
MSEIRHDLGYHNELPSEDSQRAMRRILAGEPLNDPKPDWKLDEETKEIGRRGVADTRAILEAKRKQSTGEALTPEEERILANLYQQETEE